jgi:hypothetical protein
MQNGMKRCTQIRLGRDAATVNGLYGRNFRTRLKRQEKRIREQGESTRKICAAIVLYKRPQKGISFNR